VDPSRKTSTISEYSSAALRLSDAIVQWLCLARCASLTSCGYQGRYFTFFQSICECLLDWCGAPMGCTPSPFLTCRNPRCLQGGIVVDRR
jgi:hypothetical protein